MPTVAKKLLLLTRRSQLITTFTQSVGAELLTNGDFSAWTTDNPNGWTVGGESGSDPMVTQVDPSGGAGTGAARMVATSGNISLAQAILSIGSFYEFEVSVTAHPGAGTLLIRDTSTAIAVVGRSVGLKTAFGRAGATSFQLSANSTPLDTTVDYASVKLMTLNTQATVTADATNEFYFTLPGTVVAGMRASMRYRIVDNLNYWVVYMLRNDNSLLWDIRLDSVSAGTVTNRIVATSIGAVDAMRVVAVGSSHSIYTLSGSVWTQRGTTITNTTHQTATGLNTLYSSTVTPIRVISRPS